MRTRAAAAVLVVVALAAAASAPAIAAPAGDRPGVTATQIRVGGVASTTNPLAATNGDAFAGTHAYFDMVNARGGIYGRRLRLVSERDDQISNNRTEVQGLLSEDDVFAVAPVASVLFTGADLLEAAAIPTFGWNINAEWGSEHHPGVPNMFGEKGSYLCFTCASALFPMFAKTIHAHRVGVLAYAITQSTDCLEGIKASFAKYPSAKIVFTDSSLAFGTNDLSGDVTQMIDKKVDLVTTCMDTNGLLSLAQEMKKQGLDAPQYLPYAYNPAFMQRSGQFFEGSYVLTYFAPLSVSPRPRGTAEFLRWMHRRHGTVNENSLAGWIDADLLVTGLRRAGPDFTRQTVVDALNSITHYTANGILPGIDWTVQHRADPKVGCTAISRIEGGKFVPVFGKPGRPFVCYPNHPNRLPARYVNR